MSLHMTEPPKDLPNLGMLIKLLKMTTSPHDGEALTAVRKANEALVKFGGDWESLLRGKVTVIGDPFAGMEAPPPPRAAAPPPPPQAPRAAPPFQYSPNPRPSFRAKVSPQPSAARSNAKTIQNRFAGSCGTCMSFVNTNDGFAIRDTKTQSGWRLQCKACSLNDIA